MMYAVERIGGAVFAIVVLGALWTIADSTYKSKTWVKEQHARCAAMGGRGAYFDKTYQCWAPTQPASIRMQFNKAVDFKARQKVMLFEAEYK